MFTHLSCRFVLVVALALVVMLPGLIVPAPVAAQGDIPWPTNGWLTSTPEEQGVDSAKLLALLDDIEERAATLDSLLVIRHGHIVMDAYYWPFESDTKHLLFSATKSFTSALVGIAMQQGLIEDVDQPVLDLLPGYTAADPRWSEMTLRHVLTMTAGFDCGPDIFSSRHIADALDWTQAMLDAPIKWTPGTQWEYCQVYPQLLSSIVGSVADMPSSQFARENLFEPLGISDYFLPEDPQGNMIGNGGMWLGPYDMAKLGYLYLHEGRWEDQQLISAEYVRESGCMVPSIDYCRRGDWNGWRYGYQWWVVPNLPAKTYEANGHTNQHIIVVPDRDLIVVRTAHGIAGSDALNTAIAKMAIEAASSDVALPKNPGGLTQLEARIALLAHPPSPSETVPLPGSAVAILDKWMALEPPLGFGDVHFLDAEWGYEDFDTPPDEVLVQALRLTRGEDPGELVLSMRFADRYAFDLAVGMDGVPRLTEMRYCTLAATGKVQTRGEMVEVNVYCVGNGLTDRLNFFFQSLPLHVNATSLTWPSTPKNSQLVATR